MLKKYKKQVKFMTYLTPNIQDTTISTCDQIQKTLSILHSSLRIKSSQSVLCLHLADISVQTHETCWHAIKLSNIVHAGCVVILSF